MQYEVNTPGEYFETIENDWRKEKIKVIRKMIQSYAPELKEGIEYKMLSYGKESNTVFHLNAQKAYVGFYVGNIDKIENARELLKKLDLGKGCIRIRKSIDLETTGLETFIKNAINYWRNGGDITC